MSALALRHAAYRLSHALWAALPRPTTLRACESTERSTGNRFCGNPRISCVASTSASPRAEPCDLPVFCLVGAGHAMIVLRTTRVGLLADLLAGLDRREQLVDVLDVAVAALVVGGVAAPVDGVDVPAVGLVALRDVLGERDVGVVLDRDVVLVVDQREVAELLVRGQRGGLVGDALHDVAVGGQHEDVVVEDALTGLGAGVEHLPLPTLGERHPDGGRQTRAERSGGDLDTRGVVHLRVTRSEAAPRAQRLEVLQLQRRSRRGRAGCTA